MEKLPHERKRSGMKWLRNYLIANVCALLPMLWLGLGWLPAQVKVEARGTNPVGLEAGGAVLQGEEHGAWGEGTVWRFYLREGMGWKDLAFRLPVGMDESDVGRVRLEKWKLISLGKDGAGLERKDGGANDYVFRNPRFETVGLAQGKIPLGLAGGEVLLLGVSWWFAKRHREERWKTLWPSVLGVAFALALLMQVTLPVQSYVANRTAFPFSPRELGVVLAVRFSVTMALGVLALGLLVRCFGRWILALALAVTVCAYLEAGILSAGLPSLNGDWTFFADRARSIRDAAVWGGVFMLALGLHRWLKPWYGLAGLCVAGMAAAAMLDAKPEEKADESKLIVNDFYPLGTVIRSVAYSSNRNVMVFVIDSLEREQAHAVMEDPEAGPVLREKFRGFTEYADNVGTANASEFAVANLFTGKYPESAMGFPNYFVSVYARESALADFLEENAAVYLATSALKYGYANPCRHGADSEESESKKSLWAGDGEAWGLGETCRFRWMPFGAKWWYAHVVELKKSNDGSFAKEWDAYPWLAKAPLLDGKHGTLLFLHTDGVHAPIRRGRHGEYLPEPDDTDHGAVEMGIFVMGQLGRLLDAYREKGVYDNSLIVVLADHGNHGHGPGEDSRDLPGIARPFLWVKPAESRHDFATSHVPTSHARIAALLKESSRRNLREGEIEQILQEEERLFRIAFGTGTRRDWWVKRDGSVNIEEGLLDKVPVDQIHPLQLGHVYSFDLRRASAGELEDIQLSKFFLRFFPRWFADTQDVGIAFKVPDVHARYDVRIKLAPWLWELSETADNLSEACFRFRQDGRKEDWVERPTGDAVEVMLRDLVPAEDGMIRIVGERDEGIRSVARLVEMEVSKCRAKPH